MVCLSPLRVCARRSRATDHRSRQPGIKGLVITMNPAVTCGYQKSQKFMAVEWDKETGRNSLPEIKVEMFNHQGAG